MASAAQLGMPAPIGCGPVTAATVRTWHRLIVDEEVRGRAGIRVALAVGLGMQVLIVGVFVLIAIAVRDAGEPRGEAIRIGSMIGAGVCGLMVLVSLVIKPEGRAEHATALMNHSCRVDGGEAGPLPGIFAMALMVIALYGGFCLVEALRRTRARRRLAAVDRTEAARVMAIIGNAPAGVPWAALLKTGQRQESLWLPVAVLALGGWVTIRGGGQWLTQRAPTLRLLMRRGPLAEVFGFA